MKRVAFFLVVAFAVPSRLLNSAPADVVVLSNRTDQSVQFTAKSVTGQGAAKEYKLARRDVIPVPTDGPIDIEFVTRSRRVSYRLDANSAHVFVLRDNELDLHTIRLGNDAPKQGVRGMGDRNLEAVGTLPVKILVDDDQPYTQRVWEARLRKRIQAASSLLERCFKLRLQVVELDTWDSADETTDFRQALLEFLDEVDLGTARLAIGFTSQFQATRGQTRLGGIRGPLQSHVLIREWSHYITEAERLELLLHELGHYLGAVHSPEPDSIMRKRLGDRLARDRSFLIRFDPVNTLAIYLVAEEVRWRNIEHFSQLTRPTKIRLRQIYTELQRALPDDPAAKKYLQLLH